MLIRPADSARSRTEALDFLVDHGFGHFVAAGDGRPVPVVVPTQFSLDGDHLVFHLAAANPVFAALAESPVGVMSVAGDWSYIPARWKVLPGEDPSLGIPTTYYGAVQVTGRVEVVDDPARLAQILRTQLGDNEPGSGVADPGEAHARQLRGIRGLRLPLADLRAKFKFGGNVSDAHRDVVAAGLAERGGPGDGPALRHMRRRSQSTPDV